MSYYTFKSLNLKQGELIYIQNEKGEGFTGVYENEYNPSLESFNFLNHSNGKNEIIYINELQHISKIQ